MLLIWGAAMLLLTVAGLGAAGVAAAATELWHRAYDGPAHGSDAFTAVVRGAADSAYAAGYAAATGGHRTDMLLVRYASDGTRKWVRLWNGPASGNDRCRGLARDAAGALYLAGSTAGRGGDAALVKYSAAGTLLWSRRYDSGHAQRDEARFVLPGPGGRGVYVVIETLTPAGWRWAVMRYDGDGSRRWLVRRSIDWFPDQWRSQDATTDGSGNVYVAGWGQFGDLREPLLISYSPAGAPRWGFNNDSIYTYADAVAVTCTRDGVAVATNRAATVGELNGGWLFMVPYATSTWAWYSDSVPPAYSWKFHDVSSMSNGHLLTIGRFLNGLRSSGFLQEQDGATGAGVPDGAWTWSDDVDCTGDFVAVDSSDKAWIAGKHGAGLSVLHYEPGSGITWTYNYTGHEASRALALTATSNPGACVAGWARDSGKSANAFIMRVAP
jgi:hypothetical protein